MAGLKVRKLDGTLLLDTQRITYGLVKSGRLTQGERWPRKYLRSIQLDPNNGQNWVDSPGLSDQVWNFTVPNAVAPMLFIVGNGTLNGSTISGNTITYFYLNADANTKVYAFDQMREMGSGPRLRCRNVATGALTFNSYMVPLNVLAVVQAPTIPGVPPPPYGSGVDNGSRATTYVNGYNQDITYGNSQTVASVIYSKVDIPFANEEYAAHLTFTRGATVQMQTPSGANFQFGLEEGCGGYTGGIRFMFGPAGGTPQQSSSGSWTLFYGIPTDRFPTALVIRTSNLPFPFN
ncbi:hypothetical protein [Pseudomonas rhizosphaerae]|uniref:hypothetical protein n=1 Tax=Pseudomonas rhizosphaerae TaxID=216142 RepID=UPI0011DCFA6C|nr:hypothetical protein [Pseudomonas rhizosphaerae]